MWIFVTAVRRAQIFCVSGVFFSYLKILLAGELVSWSLSFSQLESCHVMPSMPCRICICICNGNSIIIVVHEAEFAFVDIERGCHQLVFGVSTLLPWFAVLWECDFATETK